MKNTDTRVQYTRKALKKALLSLMKEKPISKITIKELCEKAELNRGTFYLHYNSPYELLEDIEKSFLEDNLKRFESFFHIPYDMNLMYDMFDSLEENREIFCLLAGKNGDPEFLQEILSHAKELTIEGWKKEWKVENEKEVAIAFDFVYAGVTDIIFKWLMGEYDISCKELCIRIERFGHYAMEAIRDF